MTTRSGLRYLGALLLVAACCALLLSSCSRCSSRNEREPGGPLLLVAPEALLRHLGPLMDGFTKTRPGERVTLVAADDDQAFEYAGRGDIFLVASRERADALGKRVTLLETPVLYLKDRVELVARSSFSLTVDRPSHLLQPAVRSIALVEAEFPAGRAARATLAEWRLSDRIAFKFVPAKDSAAALRLVEAGTVDMAFVLRSQHSAYPTLRVLLGRAQRESSMIPLYLAQVKDNPRAERAAALREFLTSPGVQNHLAGKGWLLPGQLAVPSPERVPRLPSLKPPVPGSESDGDGDKEAEKEKEQEKEKEKEQVAKEPETGKK